MHNKAKLLFITFLLPVGIFLGTWLGEVQVPFLSVFKTIVNHVLGTDYCAIDKISDGVVWHYRLSRTIFASCCGALLACCGAVLQALLRNNLADPYILGVSSGASTGAVLILLSGLGGGLLGLSMGAFLGAVSAFFIVLIMGSLIRGYSGNFGISLILSGIAVSQFFNAVTSLIITISADSDQARGIMFWLLGSLAGISWDEVTYAVVITLLTCFFLCRCHKVLDAFVFGDDYAASLGLNVKMITTVLIITTSFSTGYFISVVGAVGFVGLVIPHICRMIFGSKHSLLLPACCLIGANFMILADVTSRLLIHQQVIPIGVITALVGAPFFVVIMIRNGKSDSI